MMEGNRDDMVRLMEYCHHLCGLVVGDAGEPVPPNGQEEREPFFTVATRRRISLLLYRTCEQFSNLEVNHRRAWRINGPKNAKVVSGDSESCRRR